MGDYKAWQRAYWQALGILEGMVAQSERLYDYLPDADRRVVECYDALIEALEALERQMRRRLRDDEREAHDA